MKKITRSITTLAAGLGLAGFLALGSTLPTFAAADTGVAISGASMSGGAITFDNFTGITLNGTQRTATATWDISNVVDPRGTGAGWNVSLSLSQLQEYNTVSSAYVTGGQTLATSSIAVTTAPIVSQADVTSSDASTVTPVTDTTPIDTGSAVELLSAAQNGGMGSYAISNLTATLTVPASAYAKVYKSDATVGLNLVP